MSSNTGIGQAEQAQDTGPRARLRAGHALAWGVDSLCRLGARGAIRELTLFDEAFKAHRDRPYGELSNREALRLSWRLVTRLAGRAVQKALYLDEWHLMFDVSGQADVPFDQFNKIIPPKDRFWADPHSLHVNGRYYIFVEEYLYRAKKAHIAVIEMDEQGRCKAPVRVLEADYHLSYPFVFEWQGQYYMVPESAENESVSLYECVSFPYEWRFKMHLMRGVHAVDTTLLRHEGRWWLFTGMNEDWAALPLVKLYLFSSSELFTMDWQPHPMNPIVSDEMIARPAGRLYTRDGALFRPTQVFSTMYGSGFDLNEVVTLTETEYREKPAASVRPDWDPRIEATHTYTRDGQLTVIDVFTRRRRLF